MIDDDQDMAEAIVAALECFEFSVHHLKSAQDCLAVLQRERPEVILLDINMPERPGYDVCRQVREAQFAHVPIIALSGSQSDEDIIKMLESGADDFVAKRSSVAILIAHLRAALNRIDRQIHLNSAEEEQSKGLIAIDRNSWKVFIEGKEVQVTPTELRLLDVFVSSPGAVFTRDQLIAALHGAGHSVTVRTIDVHMNSLRNRLGALRENLETVRGIGYRYTEAPRTGG